jgi:hypothetical protein
MLVEPMLGNDLVDLGVESGGVLCCTSLTVVLSA